MAELTRLELRGQITPAGQGAGQYHYVPFAVPEGVGGLRVRYAYDHGRDAADLRGLGNTIDIGLFDARGETGFRGWSGSDRREIVIGENDATPGYLAGPIQAGTWRVILGLYHLDQRGCHYVVEVEFVPRENSVPIPAPWSIGEAPARASLGGAPGWYRGDLQCHSSHSDAKGTLDTLINTARARGLDFLAVTDHNTISHIREFPRFAERPPLLIPAMEVTNYQGHLNVWGLRDWLDFRASDEDPRTRSAMMQRVFAAAHAQGALASVNHPKTDGPPWEYGDDYAFDCIEAWQALWPFHNVEALRWWDALLCRGRRIVGVGGSDYHQPVQAMAPNPHVLGNPTTWVLAADLSVPSVLAGLKSGRVCISHDVAGPRIDMQAGGAWMGAQAEPGGPMMDVRVAVRGGAGRTLRLVADGLPVEERQVPSEDALCAFHLTRPRHYMRAEVATGAGAEDVVLALGNPVYCG